MDAYMYDLMDRNARRVIKQFPELNTTEASETYVHNKHNKHNNYNLSSFTL